MKSKQRRRNKLSFNWPKQLNSGIQEEREEVKREEVRKERRSDRSILAKFCTFANLLSN